MNSNAQALLPRTDTSADHAQGESTLRICLITLAGELFAIDLRNVREVFEVETMTPVPGMPSTLIGVANLRGLVMPLADLRPALGLPDTGPALKYAVVIQHGHQQVGVLVDQVPEIRTVYQNEFLKAPAQTSGKAHPFISRILQVEDRMSGVMEVPTLLACVETGGNY
ncbi:MAG: chemotaxis protein CheW [Nitrospiraceae bacterium]